MLVNADTALRMYRKWMVDYLVLLMIRTYCSVQKVGRPCSWNEIFNLIFRYYSVSGSKCASSEVLIAANVHPLWLHHRIGKKFVGEE